ncbi:DUF3180 domain-containing protein [Schaalia sp. Marseille-Q2122]|uniref:DUF3180 domain-containing protein n=1 Tax=Schaalia sp. Marseille-Q2122 TaxID=2736604 RepID=UPI00158BF320|nr:DUF3180 domain-containing protein [Schaalia sp. Marseille-Q2122]
MKPLTLLPLIGYGLVGMALTAGVNFVLLSLGFSPFLVSPLGALASVALAVALLIAGNGVRRLRDGKTTRMTPLWAFRIALLARASAGVNAVLVGCWLGLCLSYLPWTEAPGVRGALLWALFAALCSLVWAVSGVVVERWCQIDSDEPEGTQGGSGARSSTRHTPLAGGV